MVDVLQNFVARHSPAISAAWLNLVDKIKVRYDRTDAEIAAGVTPTNTGYFPGHLLRFGSSTTGNGVTNDTTAFTNCMASCVNAPYRMYVPKPSVKYVVNPLTIPSNFTAEFDRGVIVEASSGYGANDRMLNFTGSNVTWICNGATFRMLKSEYVSGEQRHCFYLFGCTDIAIYDALAADSGGDGFYINGVTRLLLHNPFSTNNRRNGFSVIKAAGLRGTGVWWSQLSTGTAPNDGVDFEPNGPTDSLTDIVIDTIASLSNDGNGVTFYFDAYKTGSPSDVSISIGRIISENNTNGCRVRNLFLNAGSYGGFITIDEVVSRNDSSNAVFIQDKSVNAPFLTIGRISADNPCLGATVFADTAALYIQDTSATVTGNIHINQLSVRTTHTDMDYGVIIEMGGGFNDLRVGVENIFGYQVSPVRFNNITSGISDVTNCIVEMGKLIDSLALTANTNITATTHIGRVITNSGAAGTITLSLQQYPPRYNPYRFRVETAQVLAIDVADAADRIVGTTAPGQTVTSNVVGAEADAYYLGTFGGVRYWRVQPLCNPASWTFT